jgi:hypothetical protein
MDKKLSAPPTAGEISSVARNLIRCPDRFVVKEENVLVDIYGYVCCELYSLLNK